MIVPGIGPQALSDVESRTVASYPQFIFTFSEDWNWVPGEVGIVETEGERYCQAANPSKCFPESGFYPYAPWVEFLCGPHRVLSAQYPGWCLALFQQTAVSCPSGQQVDPYTLVTCVSPAERNAGACHCQGVSDPINTGSGNLYETGTDYRSGGPFPLTFSRAYNSVIANEATSPGHAEEDLGVGWTTNLGGHLYINKAYPSLFTTPCVVNNVKYFCPPDP